MKFIHCLLFKERFNYIDIIGASLLTFVVIGENPYLEFVIWPMLAITIIFSAIGTIYEGKK